MSVPEHVTYFTDSLVPSWLTEDQGYRKAIETYLLDLMAMRDYTVITPVVIGVADGPVTPPVGMSVVRATVIVQEFDIEVPMDTEE